MVSNGQKIARQNVNIFISWMASKSDHDFRAMASRGVLSRREIATECGFAKSALDQNPRIKATLRELEDGLRERGVLPPAVERTVEDATKPLFREARRSVGALDTERLKRLETENASLKAEVAELKRTLERYATLSEALALTGRIPC